jgi:tetratricopeptide (TPR) repeat protein
VLLLENRLRVALQDLGQQVLLRYLRGEAEPQRREDFVRGERYFRSALELDPDAGALTSRALFCHGRTLLFDRRHREAIESLERAARLDPAGAYIFNALGIAYLESGDYHRAVLAFRDSIRLAPHWVYPVHNMALALTEEGDYVGAVAEYRKAIQLAPRAYCLYYNLGLVWERLNRRKDATAALRQAASLAPDSADAANAQGYLAASGGQRKMAEAFYRRALTTKPSASGASALPPNQLSSGRFSLAETPAASNRPAEVVLVCRETLSVEADGLQDLAGHAIAEVRATRLCCL